MSQNCDCQCPESVMVPMTGFGVGFNTGPIKELVKEIVREALQEHSCGIDYSFEEQWTGKYWVDGKKIYQKTVRGDYIPKIEPLYLPHGIQNIFEVINFYGLQMESNGNFMPIPYNSMIGNNNPVSAGVTPNDIQIVSKEGERPGTWYMTARYTCTDR